LGNRWARRSPKVLPHVHRKVRALVAALAAIFASLCSAQAQSFPQTVRIGGQYTSLGYCQLTSLGSAVGLSTCSGGIPTGSLFVELCSETVALRYRDDGTPPTASVGMPINASMCFQYAGPLANFSVIQAASSGILDVSFYK
jgi:hypothetical protein